MYSSPNKNITINDLFSIVRNSLKENDKKSDVGQLTLMTMLKMADEVSRESKSSRPPQSLMRLALDLGNKSARGVNIPDLDDEHVLDTHNNIIGMEFGDVSDDLKTFIENNFNDFGLNHEILEYGRKSKDGIRSSHSVEEFAAIQAENIWNSINNDDTRSRIIYNEKYRDVLEGISRVVRPYTDINLRGVNLSKNAYVHLCTMFLAGRMDHKTLTKIKDGKEVNYPASYYYLDRSIPFDRMIIEELQNSDDFDKYKEEATRDGFHFGNFIPIPVLGCLQKYIFKILDTDSEKFNNIDDRSKIESLKINIVKAMKDLLKREGVEMHIPTARASSSPKASPAAKRGSAGNRRGDQSPTGEIELGSGF